MIRALALILSLAVVPASGLQAPGTQAQEESKAEQESGKKKKEVFALTGTVFTEQGFTLPGAQISVRRVEEKKVRGKAVADRRGEFGVRLRESGEYEVTVKAKGYQTQTRKFSAQLGGSKNAVFRMQPASGGKP